MKVDTLADRSSGNLDTPYTGVVPRIPASRNPSSALR